MFKVLSVSQLFEDQLASLVAQVHSSEQQYDNERLARVPTLGLDLSPLPIGSKCPPCFSVLSIDRFVADIEAIVDLFLSKNVYNGLHFFAETLVALHKKSGAVEAEFLDDDNGGGADKLDGPEFKYADMKTFFRDLNHRTGDGNCVMLNTSFLKSCSDERFSGFLTYQVEQGASCKSDISHVGSGFFVEDSEGGRFFVSVELLNTHRRVFSFEVNNATHMHHEKGGAHFFNRFIFTAQKSLSGELVGESDQKPIGLEMVKMDGSDCRYYKHVYFGDPENLPSIIHTNYVAGVGYYATRTFVLKTFSDPVIVVKACFSTRRPGITFQVGEGRSADRKMIEFSDWPSVEADYMASPKDQEFKVMHRCMTALKTMFSDTFHNQLFKDLNVIVELQDTAVKMYDFSSRWDARQKASRRKVAAVESGGLPDSVSGTKTAPPSLAALDLETRNGRATSLKLHALMESSNLFDSG